MKLDRAILEALDAAFDSRPLSIAAILGMVGNELPTRPTLSEVEKECDRLEAKRQIVSLNDEDIGRVCKITASGRARALS